MKTIDQIKGDIKTAITAGKKEVLLKDVKKAQVRVRFLNDALAYVESNPNEQFAKKCERKVNDKLKAIRAHCKTLPRESVSSYKTENEFKKLNTQSKMLDYILS